MNVFRRFQKVRVEADEPRTDADRVTTDTWNPYAGNDVTHPPAKQAIPFSRVRALRVERARSRLERMQETRRPRSPAQARLPQGV